MFDPRRNQTMTNIFNKKNERMMENAVAISMGFSLLFLTAGLLFNSIAFFALPMMSASFVGAMVPIPFLLIAQTDERRYPFAGKIIVTGLSATKTTLHGTHMEIPIFSGIWLIGRKTIPLDGKPVFSVLPDNMVRLVKNGNIRRGETIAMLGGRKIHDFIDIGDVRFVYDKPWFGEYTTDIPVGDALIDGLLYTCVGCKDKKRRSASFCESER